MDTKTEYNTIVYTVGTIIKLVAQYDIRAISMIANNLRKHYNMEDEDEVDKIDNRVLYDCYCELAGVTE